jgi:hypothetical protein
MWTSPIIAIGIGITILLSSVGKSLFGKIMSYVLGISFIVIGSFFLLITIIFTINGGDL